MSDTKIPMERVMEMSLEEYIKETGIYNPNYREKLKQKFQADNNNNQTTINSTDNDDDFIMLDTNETDDVYSAEDMPKPSSSQWRLLPPNIPDHPVGMPPLVPLKAEILHNSLRSSKITFDSKNHHFKFQQNQQHQQNRGTGQNNQTKQQNQRFNGANNGGRQIQQNKSVKGIDNLEMKNITLQNNGTGFVNKRRNRNRNHRWNNHNNYRQFNGMNHQLKSSNIQQRLNIHSGKNQQIIAGNSGTNSNTTVKPLLDIDLRKQIQNNEMQILPYKVADNSSNAVAGENFLKNFFNTLPVIGAQLLEQIDSIRSVKNEKKYDMKVQKEISEIQGKQLLYTCPGAAVVSFDGPGIDCDTPKPHTTDMSLNQRFA